MKKLFLLIVMMFSVSANAATLMELFGFKKPAVSQVEEPKYTNSKGYVVLVNEKLSDSLKRWGNGEGVEVVWAHPADMMFTDDKQVDQFNAAVERLSTRPEKSGQTDLVAASNAAAMTMDWGLSLGRDPNLRGFPQAKICVWRMPNEKVTMIRVTTAADFTCGVEEN